MNQNIVVYLQENKDKFNKEILIEQLLKAGYFSEEIQEGIGFVYGDMAQLATQLDFWNFKQIKVYNKSSEKWKDFWFGFFAPWILGIVASVIPIVGPILSLIFYITALVYLFNRRRFIFYGMLTELIAIPIVVIVVLISVFGIGAIM